MQNAAGVKDARILGMLTPSSNTVLEPYTGLMLGALFPDVTAHYSRFRVTRIGLDDKANHQFDLETILAAADLLADARPDIIAWNGTSASWLGFDTDEKLCQAIEKRTGITATSAILSLNRILKERGIRRLGLVTPYTGDVQDRIIDNYARIDVEIVGERHAGLADNFSFARVADRDIDVMCEQVATQKPDAIAIVCTNMRGAEIAAATEKRLGLPVFNSVAFTLWGCLTALNIPTERLSDFGSLFSTMVSHVGSSATAGVGRVPT